VTPEEKKSAVKTSRIMRTARKTKGWTQVEFSKMLGVSQSALSKLESGILIPSVHQWFEFCNFAEIPTDSHIGGYLDRLQELKFLEKVEVENFKVKKEYLVDAASSARSMAPMIQWLYSNLGELKSRKLLKEMGVDSDYFVDLMKKKGLLKKQGLESLAELSAGKSSHGSLFSKYHGSDDAVTLLQSVFDKAPFYELNFDYRIEDAGNSKVQFSVIPQEHILANKALKFAEISDQLPGYRAGYFNQMLSGILAKSSKEHSNAIVCIDQNPNRSLFEMKLA
jgi:transcriptional regulator with XRE-family HTH domain